MNDLGVWLAENVMGWKQCRASLDLNTMAWYVPNGHFEGRNKWQVDVKDWDPLSNDAQAQMVKQRMIALRWACHQETNSDLHLSHLCRFAKPTAGSHWVSARDENRPICEAAKNAIEAERAQEKKRHTCRKRLDVEAYHMFDVWWKHMSNGCWDRVSNDECPFCGEELNA